MIGEHDKKAVAAFFDAIKPLRAAYSDPTFSYLAIRTTQGLLLLKGHVSLNVTTIKVPLGHFASANVYAGRCLLSELAASPEQFIEIIAASKRPRGPSGRPGRTRPSGDPPSRLPRRAWSGWR